MDETQKKVLKKAIDTYGKDFQLVKCIEELGELITAISRFLQMAGGGYTYLNLLEEIADVEIMIEQAKMVLNNREIIEEQKKMKVERLDARMIEEEELRNGRGV